MANFSIVLSETGLTLVGRVYNSSGVQQGADVTMTESATNVYTGTYDESGLATGTYDEFPVLFAEGSEVKGQGTLKVEDGAEVNDRLLQDAIDRADSIKSKTDQLNFTGSDVQSVASNMRGTDNAFLASSYTAPDNATITAISNAVAALNDLSVADVDARLAAYDAPTLTEMTAAFTEIKGSGWTATDTLEAINNAITGSGGGSLSQILYNYFTADARPDPFRADVSSLATAASVAALNDISTADIRAQADAALTAYDAPTKAEFDAAIANLATAAAVALIPTNPLLTNDARLDNLDAKVSEAKKAAEDAPFI